MATFSAGRRLAARRLGFGPFNPSGAAAADDPAFTGAAGDPGAYFALDGGDYFTLASGANTAFIDALQKTTGGAAFWIADAWRHSDGSTNVNLATNSAAGARGVRLLSTAGEAVQFQQRGDATNVVHTGATLVSGADYLLVLSCPAGGGTIRTWLATTTKTESAFAYDATAGGPDGVLSIGAETDAGAPLPAGTRLYHVSMGNAYIDDAEAAAIFAHLEARHGRDYTP